jgi:hypothetical protein
MADSSRTNRTTKKSAEFLEALSQTCNITRSCEICGLPRRTVYDWRAADPEFAKAWEDALDKGADVLEDEAKRRAHDGVEEPVYYGGKQVGTVRKYSDVLLIFLLKGARPKKYGDRSVRIAAPDGEDGGGPIVFQVKSILEKE